MADSGNILANLDRRAIEAAYAAGPGNEIASGKFLSKESSAALAANAFGLFFERPELMPPLPGTESLAWPATQVAPEIVVRFPWTRGRHPCFDMLIEMEAAVIGVESKRYEPYRPRRRPSLSAAYWRPVWGQRMSGFQEIRDGLKQGSLVFYHLDAAQLVKHALGLLSNVQRTSRHAALLYLYAEADAWPDGRRIARAQIERHRKEIAFFATRVRGDAVKFVPLSYASLLRAWQRSTDSDLRSHAIAVRNHFAFCSADGALSEFEPLWRTDEPGSSYAA